MLKLRMLMGSLLENWQSTINTSPAHGKKKMLQYIPVTGKFEVMVYNTCFLQQTSFLVIWFDCLEKKVCLQWQKVLCILETFMKMVRQRMILYTEHSNIIERVTCVYL